MSLYSATINEITGFSDNDSSKFGALPKIWITLSSGHATHRLDISENKNTKKNELTGSGYVKLGSNNKSFIYPRTPNKVR